jgi:hypothetical protein
LLLGLVLDVRRVGFGESALLLVGRHWRGLVVGVFLVVIGLLPRAARTQILVGLVLRRGGLGVDLLNQHDVGVFTMAKVSL